MLLDKKVDKRRLLIGVVAFAILAWSTCALLPGRAEFGSDPLLFISERGDLHLEKTRAHSRFFKVNQSDKYKYGMRTESEDTLISADDFYTKIDERRKEHPWVPMVVFVHGCCVSFGECMLQGNDLEKAMDKSFTGPPTDSVGRPVTLVYDWATPFSYGSSLAYCYAAQSRFESFMQDLVSRYGAKNMIIVAHSLGGLMVQTYIHRLEDKDKSQIFRAIVFSRPDVDRQSFKQCLPALKAHSERLILLASSNDPNIYASSLLRRWGIKFAQAAMLPTSVSLQAGKMITTPGYSPGSASQNAARAAASRPAGRTASVSDNSSKSPNSDPPTGPDKSMKAADAYPPAGSQKSVPPNDGAGLAKDAPTDAEKSKPLSRKVMTRRLGQVKAAREFSDNVDVYDMSYLRIGHGIPYGFIGDILSDNVEPYDLKKDVNGVVIVHSARP